MRIVDTDHDLHLRLSPKAGTIRRPQTHTGIECGVGVLYVRAGEFDSRLIVQVPAQVVIRPKLKASFLGTGHLTLGVKLHPLSASPAHDTRGRGGTHHAS